MRKDAHASRNLINPLGWFSSVPAVNLSGIIRSEKQLFSPKGPTARMDGDPLGRMDFPSLALFSSSGLGFPHFGDPKM